jgi:hypothetical protein
MAYIVPNQGENRILSGAFRNQGLGNVTIHLYSSALEFTATMSAGTHVTALSAGGYAGIAISATAWSAPFLSAGSAVVSASGNATNGGFLFSFTAAPIQSAYGYYLASTTHLQVVESFSDGPYYLSNSGDTVTVTPYIKLGSGSGN